MQILQLKTAEEFKNMVPDQGTVLIWPELKQNGQIVLHSRTHEGINNQIGNGFGQIVNVFKEYEVEAGKNESQIVPFFRKNDQNQLQLSAKLHNNEIVTIDGGIQSFGKNIKIHRDEQFENAKENNVIPYIRQVDDQLQLVVKKSNGQLENLSVNNIRPAICVEVNQSNGTCSAVQVQIYFDENGQMKTRYKGQKIQNLIYKWNKPQRQDLRLILSGYTDVNDVNTTYLLQTQYLLNKQRIWVNQQNLQYVIIWDKNNLRWCLCNGNNRDNIISYQTTYSLEPFGDNVVWSNNIICRLYQQ